MIKERNKLFDPERQDYHLKISQLETMKNEADVHRKGYKNILKTMFNKNFELSDASIQRKLEQSK